MNRLSFAPKYGWVDKPDEDDVLILHAGDGIPINKCTCYRCRTYKIRKKQDFLRMKVRRDLTAEELQLIGQQVNEETAAAARE